jgi:hypothetical protein
VLMTQLLPVALRGFYQKMFEYPLWSYVHSSMQFLKGNQSRKSTKIT